MTIASDDLGDLEKLATAIGLIDADGDFREDWLSRPEFYLSQTLASDTQRAALITFVDEILGGAQKATDAQGRIWLPIVETGDPDVTFSVVVDESPATHVRMGLGVAIETSAPISQTHLHLPLFRAAKGTHSNNDPLLLGKNEGAIGFSTDIMVDSTSPTPGSAHLGSIGLSLEVPTGTGSQQPSIALTLGQLQLPGATAPRDLTLSLDSLDTLDDQVLEIVLGLIQAQAGAAAATPLAALAGLLGLRGGLAVPALPVSSLATQGPAALAQWFDQLMGSASARTAWLGQLAQLLGGSASVVGDTVTLTVGSASVVFGVTVQSGAAGRHQITPTLGVQIASGNLRAQVDADLVRLDLGDGSAVAVPRLSVTATAGQTPAGGTPILTGDPAVAAVRVGVALNQARRPVVILVADQVMIGTNSYDMLDLSTPDAIADSLGTVIGDAIDDLLAQLGTVGTAIRPILGLAPPPGFPAVPTVTLSTFMANPLTAVGGYWRTLVRDHVNAVPALIDLIRPLLADATAAVIPVAGTGTAADPWRMSLIGPVELQLVSDTPNDTLAIALAGRYVVDTLGLRCTRVQTQVAVALLEVGLGNGQLVVAGRVDVRLTLRARGSTQARFSLGPLLVSADHIGFATTWAADTGLAFDALAPNLTVEVSSQSMPVGLPRFKADGTPDLDDAGFDAVERLLGLLAVQSSVPAFSELARALGWVADDADLTQAPDTLSRSRLRLADLANDPATALPNWTKARLFDTSGGIEAALSVLSRLLTGSVDDVGQRLGNGRLDSPYRLGLFADGVSPELAFWLEPHGPRRPTVTDVSDALRAWHPGVAGLDAAQLAEALSAESLLADSLAMLTDSRDLSAGLQALINRWEGTDGRIVPPVSDPAGVSVHRVFNTPVSRLETAIDVESLLGSSPTTTLHIAVVGASDPLPWASAPAQRVIDLREANRIPESFPVPADGAGNWFVALAPRADAILAVGDTDGTEGQAARLQRILGAFDGVGGLLLRATGGAGHAARLAAERTVAVSALITQGTPAGPVAFTVLDTPPASDVLRMLHALLPEFDTLEPDDTDLALGRDLLTAFTRLLPMADPAVELRPPATAAVPPRAGLSVHAVFGVLERSDIERALSAVVAAALSMRAGERANRFSLEPVSAAGMGVRLPITSTGTDLQVVGDVLVEGLSVDLSGTLPSLRNQHSLVVNLTLQRRGGWLVGGPDPARGPGPKSEHELRALQATIRLPLHGGGSASAEITLLEPRVFGIRRPRWVVSAAGSNSASMGVVTPALPEVGVLLAQVAEQLSAATDVQMGFFKDLLDRLGLMDASGGFNAGAIDHLLYEPAAHLGTVMASATDRQGLNTAVNGLLGAVSGLTLDLSARQLSLDLTGLPGVIGLAPWRLQLTVGTSGPPQFEFTLGSAGTTAAGGIGLSLSSQPFAVKLERYRPLSSTPERWTVWPSPDVGLATAMLRVAPAELVRVGLGYLRDLDEGARPIVDAALDALGLLAPVAADGSRAILLPLTLLEDPIAWFSHSSALGGAGGLEAGKIIALLDAFKPLLGITGGAGEWQLASGLSLRATETGGVARLGLQLDTSSFAALPAGPGQFVLSGEVGLRLPVNQAPQPDIDLALGMTGASPGRRALHVALNGGLQVYLRPAQGADLSLYPDPPGLGALAQTAVTQALPLILDALADETGADLAGDVGTVVRAVGDAMALRNPAGDFDAALLQTWATDPAGAFASRLPVLSTAMISQLAGALGPLLPSPATASATTTGFTVDIGSASIALQTAPFEVAIAATVSGLAGVSQVVIDTRFDATGLATLSFDLGPADIDAGGISLRPYFSVAAGASPAGGQRAEIGLALNATGQRAVGGRWLIDTGSFSLIAVDGPTIDTDPASVALAMVEATLQMVASFAMSTTAVDQLLNTTLPGAAGSTVRNMMAGVFLENIPNPSALDSNLFDPARLLGRLQQLLVNLAGAGPSINVAGGLSVGLSTSGSVAQVTLGLSDRFNLTEGDLVISLEADSRWIKNTPTAGLSIGLIDTAGSLSFSPSLSVDGLGIRVSRQTTPLLDAGITLGSVAAHVFARVSASELSGGLQIQLSNLAVGVSGGTGGNPVAQGLVADADSGSDALAPAFSPAFAVQKHGADPVLLSLRAGDGDGPWWLPIQKGFGPLYIEQVGLDTTIEQDRLIDISVLLDGGVSIAGLAAAVDDLSLTFVVGSDASVFDPSRWRVDLAGLAVSADMAGVTLAGGLRKFGSGENVEYIGMLLARFATYGLSVYGGYGTKVEAGSRFTAFFAFGAINGPIGGPPAFFLTGIGGGLGINRNLILPDDLSRFGDFPFIKALDPGASPPSNPMAELVSLRDTFPMKRGDFWFAAGLSFTSFALVDGVAVVSVKIGDGLEIALLGLARMALPRPQVALVSIELGLIARFSTKEGVLWIQAQLTDNSWLLHESVRLTGGFAFVSWFDGPNRGQFVLTIGGFHPNFHRDGYPNVPRLGFRWSVSSAIVVKGESYFALTSEAIMAGGKLEASAKFGPAWAHVVFGADGIVYFDPFRFEVSVYASISAGITIDFWIGKVTIRIHIGARIDVVGPKIRGVARFEIGPVELSVAFGDKQKAPKVYLTWNEFVPKYLEEARPGVARCITALPGKGALPPGTGPGGATDTATADGSVEKPFLVLSEFELTITSTVPNRSASFSTQSASAQAPSHDIGLGPINEASVSTTLSAALRDSTAIDHLHKLTREIRFADGFPMGVWGNPQPDDDRKLPKGDVIRAIEGGRFEAVASIQGSLPKEMAYKQVESDQRKPLPFVHARKHRAKLILEAGALAAIVPQPDSVNAMYAAAKPWLAKGGNGATALAALERDRSAPPLIGSLTEDLANSEPRAPVIRLPDAVADVVIDRSVWAPEFIGLLTAEIMPEIVAPRTTVRRSGAAVRMAPPSLAQVDAKFDWAVPAKLVRVATPASPGDMTVRASRGTPFTRAHHAGVAAIRTRGAAIDGQDRLVRLTRALVQRTRAAAASTLEPGEIAVMCLPNAQRDTDTEAQRPQLAIAGASARLLALASGGRVLLDHSADRSLLAVPQGTERLVVLATGERSRKVLAGGLHGWHAGLSIGYLGWATALISGGTLSTEGSRVRRGRERFRVGWINAAEFVEAAAIVNTQFRKPVRTIVIALDDATLQPSNAGETGLSLALSGADREQDHQQQPLPPTLVNEGNRSYLVYRIAQQSEAADKPVTVSIARESGWRLAGVMSSQLDAQAVIDQLAGTGLDSLLQPLAASRTGTITLRWKAAKKPGGAKKAPTEKPVTGKAATRKAKTKVKNQADSTRAQPKKTTTQARRTKPKT